MLPSDSVGDSDVAADSGVADGGGAPQDGGVSARVVVEYKVVGGARIPTLGFYDKALSTYCYVGMTTAGLRCVPSTYTLDFFADAGCTQAVVVAAPLAGCEAPRFAKLPTTVSCTPVADRIYVLNSGTKPANYYAKSGASCLAIPLPASGFVYTSGPELDPTTLAPASIER